MRHKKVNMDNKKSKKSPAYGEKVVKILLDMPRQAFSVKKITMILEEQGDVNRTALNRAIKKLIADKKIKNTKGVGLGGSLKIDKDYKDALAKEEKAKEKKKKAAAKKAEKTLKSPTKTASAKKKAANKAAKKPKTEKKSKNEKKQKN